MKTVNQSEIKNGLIELIAQGRKLEQQIEQLLNKDERRQIVNSNENQSE